MYDKSFKIKECTGNNAFSFKKRPNPKLHVPTILEGNIEDAKIGTEIAFEDFDENEELKSCVGLKNFIRTTHPKTGAPVIIVDNHNHVFYFWHEAREKGIIKNDSTLIHIDQHKDMREPKDWLSKEGSHNLEKVFRYTNDILNVGNYIIPAQKTGLIGEIILITSEKEIQKSLNNKSEIINHKSKIVNIDLDFWADEMSYIDEKMKTEIAQKYMNEADLITIATSPFFIGQEKAIKSLGRLFGIL